MENEFKEMMEKMAAVFAAQAAGQSQEQVEWAMAEAEQAFKSAVETIVSEREQSIAYLRSCY